MAASPRRWLPLALPAALVQVLRNGATTFLPSFALLAWFVAGLVRWTSLSRLS